MRVLMTNAAAFVLTAAISLLLLGYTEEPMLVPSRAFRVALDLYGGFFGAVFAFSAMLFTTLLFRRIKTKYIIFGLITAVVIVNVGLFLVGEWNVWRMIIVVVSVTFASTLATLLEAWMKYKQLIRRNRKTDSIAHDSKPSKAAPKASADLNFK